MVLCCKSWEIRCTLPRRLLSKCSTIIINDLRSLLCNVELTINLVTLQESPHSLSDTRVGNRYIWRPQFSGGIWVVAKLLQTKRRAQANLQKVSSKCPRNKETENVIKIDHQHYSFTSIGSESLPPAETDVATLKVVTDFVTSLARAAMKWSPVEGQSDDGSDNTVPHRLRAQAMHTRVQISQ